MNKSEIETLLETYRKSKPKIKRRLREFKDVWLKSERVIFAELCFCICTPQSKAVLADKAIKSLVASRKLFNGNFNDIRSGLVGVRFPNNKARYIYEAKEQFSVGSKIKIKDRIIVNDIFAAREWIVKNIKGIGYKEAGHFLRNIGFGRNLAILDVHILNNMLKYRVISEKPKSLTKLKYLEIETVFLNFADKLGIPPVELDLLLWSIQTGKIFK